MCGITAIIGFKSTFVFFSRKEKIKGTICFLGGIFLVLCKYPFIGFAVEIFGFLNLFGYGNICGERERETLTRVYSDFFPVVFGFLKRLPVIGPILSHPALARVRYFDYSSILEKTNFFLFNLVCAKR